MILYLKERSNLYKTFEDTIIKRTSKSLNFLCGVIILFSTALCKSAFLIYLLENEFLFLTCFLSIVFWMSFLSTL